MKAHSVVPPESARRHRTAEPAAAISGREFANAMARFGPFERPPRLAVAVSGGADSLCLVLLADRWVRALGGTVTALTVDHGLRPESAAEAAQVAKWMAAEGIGHRVLEWVGPKPGSAVQSSAREARYGLLETWCRASGTLHLLVGHHRGDLAETVMLRRDGGSASDGLAAMPALAELAGVRLLRPLLAFPGARLRATLIARGRDWIEDPSNLDRNFARVRARERLAERTGDTEQTDLITVAAAAAVQRSRNDRECLAVLARGCTLHPAGFAHLDRETVLAASHTMRARLVKYLIRCVSGRAYAPRSASIDRFARALVSPRFSARTLGGCLFSAYRNEFLVCREARNLAPSIALRSIESRTWDGRFVLGLTEESSFFNDLTLGALGHNGWREVNSGMARVGHASIPASARWTLPALRDGSGVSAVPHLGYKKGSSNSWDFSHPRLLWRPKNALSRRPLWLELRELRAI
jgi:tRNA(Ile)-lysidine synthase